MLWNRLGVMLCKEAGSSSVCDDDQITEAFSALLAELWVDACVICGRAKKDSMLRIVDDALSSKKKSNIDKQSKTVWHCGQQWTMIEERFGYLSW